jgi:hypothetical protein
MPLHVPRILIFLPCLWLAGCAGSLEPKGTYRPPRGAAPMENSAVETGALQSKRGSKGDKIGAEIVGTEKLGDLQSIEIKVPMKAEEVDEVQVLDESGQEYRLTRDAEIIRNTQTGDVGIKIEVPNSNNLNFRLRLIDHPDDDWPPMRDQ